MSNVVPYQILRRKLTVFLVLAGTWWASCTASGAEPDQASTNTARLSTNAPVENDQALRAYLRLQEQMHTTLLAIERARQESSDQTRTATLAQAARLESLERTLEQNRDEQLQSLHQANRTTLVAAATVVAVGLLVLAATALFQARRGHRPPEFVPGSMAGERALLTAGFSAPLESEQPLLLGPGSTLGPNKALLATIQRLEERVRELEQNAPVDAAPGRPALINGDHQSPGASERRNTWRGGADRMSVLMGKGQMLLNLGKADGALACYEQILTETPNHADAYLKKGNALERLKRWDEAVAAYDSALGLNQGLTEAHLGKAAVFNQQERYNEALECYERALRSEAPLLREGERPREP